MKQEEFSDEALMRFADGDLDEATAARLEKALEADDRLMERLALFTETRAASQAALKPLLTEPVPEKLVAAVEDMIARKRSQDLSDSSPKIVPFPAAASKRTDWRLPLAASLAAALLGAAAGYWLAGPAADVPGTGVQIAGLNEAVVSNALRSVSSGAEISLNSSGDRFRAIATFRDSSPALCREFEIDAVGQETVVAVACHRAGAWEVSFAVVAPGADGGYAPASSTEALDAYLGAIDAAAPLSLEEETKALGAIETTME